MLTSLEASNFKSWRSLAPIRLAPVTGFFGTNSSGKTSLLQLILLLKQTAASSDRAQALQLGDERTLVELGAFRDVIYGHDHDLSLELGVGWETPETLTFINPETESEVLFKADSVRFATSISATKAGRMEVNRFRYDMDSTVVELMRSAKQHGRKDPEYELSARVKGRDHLKRVPGRAWPLPSPVKCYGFPDEAIAYYQNSGFIGEVELALERQLTDRTFYLGPLRSDPLRQYRWQGTHPPDVGPAGDRAVEALLASRERGRPNARAFDKRGYAKRRISVEQHVAEWLTELGLVHSFEVNRISEEADIYRVRVRKNAQSAPVNVTDIGFGVSQILPVLVLLAYVPEHSTVLLEQPEIHLHPRVQSGLADVILETARARRVQVLVESHSEHLLRRLQLRVAQQELEPEDVALFFCDMEGAESVIDRLRVNVLGEIENWPKGFFGDPLGETAAIAQAAIRQRQQVG